MTILEQMEILRHMLGMATNVPMKQWGWRNYFNSGPGPDLETLRALETQKLVEQYRPNYWRATELGMSVAGLPLKARMKLLSPTQATSGEQQ